MEETLLEYLKRNKAEREAKLEAYGIARTRYEEAKRALESFGDITETVTEVEKLDGYINQLSAEQGAVGDGEINDGEPEA